MCARRGGAHLLIGRGSQLRAPAPAQCVLAASSLVFPLTCPGNAAGSGPGRRGAARPGGRRHAPRRGLEALRTRGPPGSAGHRRGRRAEDGSGGALRRARPLGTLPSAPGWPPPPSSLPQSGSRTPCRCAGQAGGQCALLVRAVPSPLSPKPGPPKLSAPLRPSTSSGRSGARLPGAALVHFSSQAGLEQGARRSLLRKPLRQPPRRKREGGHERASERAGEEGGCGDGGGRDGASSLLLLPAAGPARPQQLETYAGKGTEEVLQSEARGGVVTTG